MAVGSVSSFGQSIVSLMTLMGLVLLGIGLVVGLVFLIIWLVKKSNK